MSPKNTSKITTNRTFTQNILGHIPQYHSFTKRLSKILTPHCQVTKYLVPSKIQRYHWLIILIISTIPFSFFYCSSFSFYNHLFMLKGTCYVDNKLSLNIQMNNWQVESCLVKKTRFCSILKK